MNPGDGRAISVAMAAPRPHPIRSLLLVGVLFASALAVRAEARSAGDCKLAWSKAVRSYLTKNRKAAPDGSVPADMDAMERAAQAWMEAFAPACSIEAAGDKPAARVEAALLGTRILAQLDPRGCARFLEYYMESTRPTELCQAAAGGAPSDALRQQIAATIP